MSKRNHQVANFKLPSEMDIKSFEASLSKARKYVTEEPVVQGWRLYDSFDWRLFNKSLILRRTDSQFLLLQPSNGATLECEAFVGPPLFVRDLPAGGLRDALQPILNVRALLEMARVTLKQTTHRILNDDRKTVIRLVVTEVRPGAEETSPPLETYLSVEGVRGYDGHARRLRKELLPKSEIGCLDEAIYAVALAAAGQSPNSYSSALSYDLAPDQPAGDATRVVMQRLLQNIRANEAGIRNDIDTEFLHEYRVAIRRTRAALSELKGVFTETSRENFKQAFRELGRNTNELRDLDVHLLGEARYSAMLPKPLRDHISPVFDLLRARRSSTLEKVIASLDQPSYSQTLWEWESFLEHPPALELTAPKAKQPIIVVARQRIYKQYRRIVRDGNFILDNMEDQLLHELRLECKKLRYLLEAFACLFPRKRVRRLIKQLKQLQENLGEFTDLAVKQEWLLGMAGELTAEDPRTRQALLAAGALIDNLGRRQQSVKAKFAMVFRRFESPKNQQTYREFFAPDKKRKKGKADA